MRKSIILPLVLAFALAGAANAINPNPVNWVDLAVFSNQWLAEANSVNSWCNGTDLNHSGRVNFADFSLFAQYWQKQTPAYYVAPYGNDNNPGTLMRPFKTIQKAANVMVPGDTCYVRGGHYHEEMIFDAIKGTSPDHLTFTNYNDEEVIVGGTIPIETGWSVHSGNIYKTTLSQDIWDLFVDCEQMQAARWPNCPDFDVPDNPTASEWEPTPGSFWDKDVVQARMTQDYSSGTIHNDDTYHDLGATSKSFDGAVVIIWGGSSYNSDKIITSHIAGESVFTYADPVPVHSLEKSRYFIECDLDALDAEGEWFFDKNTKELYLWPEGGGAPSGYIEGRNKDWNLVFINDSRYIDFSGITFLGGAFRINKCPYITFDTCRFLYSAKGKRMLGIVDYPQWPGTNISGRAASNHTWGGTGAHDNSWINCEFGNIEVCGLYHRGGPNTLVENCFFHNGPWCDPIDGALSPKKGGGMTVRRVTFRTVGFPCSTTQGDNGLLEYCRTEGMYFNGDFSGHQVPQSYAHHNVLHHNWVLNAYDRNGIRFDGDPAGIRCQVNHIVSYRSMRGFRMKGDQHKIYNLTSLNSAGVDLNIAFEKFYGYDPPDCLEYECRIMGRRGSHPYHGNELSIAHNLAADSITNWPIVILDPCDKTGIWHGNALGKKLRDQLRDPHNWDFRPRAGSELIDAGTHVPGITDGYIGSAPDIGAYEYGDPNYWIPGCKFDKASCPIPPNGTQTAKSDADLMWLEGIDAVSHDVWFGTDPANLVFKGNQTNNIFNPGTMDPNTTYYWRIDTVTESETITGDVWSFTTEPQFATYYATDDSFVIEDKPNSNYNHKDFLRIQGGATSYAHQVYVKFNVTDLPGSVASATLRLHTQNVAIDDVSIYEADNTWNEAEITWNNKPDFGPVITGPVDLTAYTWCEFDVSSYVTGEGTYTFGVWTTDGGTSQDFDSRENTSGRWPELVIEYTSDGGADQPIVRLTSIPIQLTSSN